MAKATAVAIDGRRLELAPVLSAACYEFARTFAGAAAIEMYHSVVGAT